MKKLREAVMCWGSMQQWSHAADGFSLQSHNDPVLNLLGNATHTHTHTIVKFREGLKVSEFESHPVLVFKKKGVGGGTITGICVVMDEKQMTGQAEDDVRYLPKKTQHHYREASKKVGYSCF